MTSSTYSSKSSSSATKANAIFKGWKLNDEITYTSDYAGAININADWTLTAQFDDIKYDVTYKAGSGTGTDVVEKLTAGSAVTLKTFAETGFTAPDGKVFYRWTIGGVEYAEGANFTNSLAGDTTVTAKYVDNTFTVEYSNGGQSGVTLPEKKTYTVGTEEVQLTELTLAYYYVTGYSTTLGDAGLAVNAKINTSSCVAGDEIVVTPTWAEKMVAIDYQNGGYSDISGLPADTSVAAKDGYTISSTVPTVTGYEFTYWMSGLMNEGVTVSDSENDGGTGMHIYYAPGETITFSGDLKGIGDFVDGTFDTATKTFTPNA